MKSKAYIIAGNKIVAEVRTSLKSGEIVRFAYNKVREKINAAREWNLVNSWPGKISRAKKWEKKFRSQVVHDVGEQINYGEFFIF